MYPKKSWNNYRFLIQPRGMVFVNGRVGGMVSRFFLEVFVKQMLRWSWLGGLVIASAACGVLKKKDSSKGGAGGDKEVSLESVRFEMPAKGDATLIVPDDIQAGSYKLVEIATSYVSRKEKSEFESVFIHKMAKAGDPKKGDAVLRATYFSKADTEDTVYYPYVEISLSASFEKVDGKDAEFSEPHYYWNQNRSDGGWGWSLSGDKSSRGDKFVLVLLAGENKDNIYSVSKDEITRKVAIRQVDESTLEIYHMHEQPDLTSMFRLTYKK